MLNVRGVHCTWYNAKWENHFINVIKGSFILLLMFMFQLNRINREWLVAAAAECDESPPIKITVSILTHFRKISPHILKVMHRKFNSIKNNVSVLCETVLKAVS